MCKQLSKPAQETWDGTIVQVGMPLVDIDGMMIGIVKEIQDEWFLVDRTALHFQDLFVPYWICIGDGAGQIKVEITHAKINQNIVRSSDWAN